jgi:4-hydroxy-tetrahydrodipicolinate reductase
MKIALLGYGKMGHEIELAALARNHQIVLTIDKDTQNDLTLENIKKADVAIEFSTPSTVYQNIKFCLEAGMPIVVGTTGWLDHLEDAKQLLKKSNASLFYASNYSIGVNLFFRANKVLSSYINSVKGYTAAIKEIHHTQKLDAPSGTAITLAQIVTDSMDDLNGWTLLPNKESNKIPIEAVRVKDVPGIHSITFDSEQDEIIFIHRAKNRKGFALGAVLAAEFINGKKGFYSMDDLLKIE